MTFKDWDKCLKFLEVLTKWPSVILYLAFLFRGAIAKKLSGLEKIKVKETEIIFRTLTVLKKVAQKSSPELVQQYILNVPTAVIAEKVKRGASEAGEKEDNGEENDAVDTEKTEIDHVLDVLKDDDQETTE